MSTGQRFFVHSGTGTNGTAYGFTPDKPFATVDYAISKCTASKGDIVFVMPGHAENITSATGMVFDIAGVQVIGIGTGRLKPQISITTATTSTISFTAANCVLENVDIINNFLDIAATLTIAATATGTTLRNIRVHDTSVILGALVGIAVAADADDLTIDGFEYHGFTLTALATNCILFAGGCDRLKMSNVFIVGSFSNVTIAGETALSIDISLNNITTYNKHATGTGIHMHASTTGVARNLEAFNAASVGLVGEAILQSFTCRVNGANSVTSMLNAAIDT